MSKLSEGRLIEWVRYWQGYRYSGMLENADNEEKQEAGEQIVAMIKKPGVTEEWIEEKAKEFLAKTNISVQTPEAVKQQLKIIQDFIRSLIEEISS